MTRWFLPTARPISCSDCPNFQRPHTSIRWLAESFTRLACAIQHHLLEKRFIADGVASTGNNILDSVRPPWEAATLGVVSLMTMLEFAARRYVELSHQLGLLLGTHCKRTPGKDFADSVGYLLSETKRLGLRTTQEHIYDWIRELMKENPGRVKLQSDGLVTIHDIELNSDRTCHHIETIYSAMGAELSVILFRAIPKEKNGFCDSEWLRNTVINKFPETVDEFQKAGRCFAYGENTACVFHLMRVADFYF